MSGKEKHVTFTETAGMCVVHGRFADVLIYIKHIQLAVLL